MCMFSVETGRICSGSGSQKSGRITWKEGDGPLHYFDCEPSRIKFDAHLYGILRLNFYWSYHSSHHHINDCTFF